VLKTTRIEIPFPVVEIC